VRNSEKSFFLANSVKFSMLLCNKAQYINAIIRKIFKETFFKIFIIFATCFFESNPYEYEKLTLERDNFELSFVTKLESFSRKICNYEGNALVSSFKFAND